MTDKPMWMVRAGRGGVYAEEFVRDGFVGIGWRDGGDPTAISDKGVLIARFAKAYPDATEQSRFVMASIVFRFVREVQPGDGVATYDPATRVYHYGTIIGPALWNDDPDDARNTCRAVEWRGVKPRDALSIRARNTLGATLSLFLLPADVAAEFGWVAPRDAAKTSAIPTPPPLVDAAETAVAAVESDRYADIAELAVERIKDRIVKLDWEQLQELVAALLRTMGYKTRVSPRGADRGRDIIASPDGFGFGAPRIVVEVKHRPNETMGAPQVRAMPVGTHPDDRGLFVSTGGFTREAQYEAERGRSLTTLMTLDDLARAIIDSYPAFDERGRALLPLTRIYWPD